MSKITFNILILTFIAISSTELNHLIYKKSINEIDYNHFRKLEDTQENKNNTEAHSKSKQITCNIKNCEKCGKTNECKKCKNNFKLLENRCYNTECQIFGFCSYCDEFDCIQCEKGYQLNFGTCDKQVNGFKKKLILGILIPTIFISIILYIYLYIKKKK